MTQREPQKISEKENQIELEKREIATLKIMITVLKSRNYKLSHDLVNERKVTFNNSNICHIKNQNTMNRETEFNIYNNNDLLSIQKMARVNSISE